MKRRLICSFLLLEVVASLGLFAFFSAALITPYARVRQNLIRYGHELHERRFVQLAAMQLHTPGQLNHFLPTWSSSSPQLLENQSWDWNQDSDFGGDELVGTLPVRLLFECAKQIPARERKGWPVWRRLLVASWYQGEKRLGSHTFIAISGWPANFREDPNALLNAMGFCEDDFPFDSSFGEGYTDSYPPEPLVSKDPKGQSTPLQQGLQNRPREEKEPDQGKNKDHPAKANAPPLKGGRR